MTEGVIAPSVGIDAIWNEFTFGYGKVGKRAEDPNLADTR